MTKDFLIDDCKEDNSTFNCHEQQEEEEVKDDDDEEEEQ